MLEGGRGRAEVLHGLSRAGFLRAVAPATLEQICDAGHRRTFDAGETLMHQGEREDFALLVLTGRLKVTTTSADGQEMVHNFLVAGDFVGEIALLDGGERTANVVALDSGAGFQLSRGKLLPILRADPDALLGLLHLLCGKLRLATKVHEASIQPMDARLVSGLLRLAERYGRACEGGVRIDLDLTQTELGNFVQISRANVSRQLAHLKSAGVIEIKGAEIVIRDPKRLARIEHGEDH